MIAIPIPLGRRHEVTLTGRIPKLVRCEQCGYEYVYLLQTSASGESFSPLFFDDEGARRDAQAEAEARLKAAARDECAVVPCAHCGHVQAHMVPLARRQYRPWMLYVAIANFTAGALLAVPAMIIPVLQPASHDITQMPFSTWLLWGCVAALMVCAYGFFFSRSLWQQRYDPNALAEEFRKTAGEILSLSKNEFLKSLQPKACLVYV